MTEPAAWLRASAGAAILPTAMPVWTLSTRTWPSQVSTSTSITCTDLGTPAPTARLEKRRSIQPKIMPMMPASFIGERTPGAVGFESSGRILVTLRSGEAAIISRHGALEPGTGLRLAFCSIASFSFCTASNVGGITEAVLRLPPAPGPTGRLESPIRTSTSCGSSPNSFATVLAITVRLPWPMSWVAGLAEIQPVAGGDADAAAIAAGLRCRCLVVAPHIEAGGPVIEALAVRIGIPAFSQHDRIELHSQRGLVDRLFQRERHRRSAGTAERRAGRQVADDVVIGQLLGFRRIDQAGEGGERRVGRRPGSGIRSERQRLEIALLGGQQRDLHLRRR